MLCRGMLTGKPAVRTFGESGDQQAVSSGVVGLVFLIRYRNYYHTSPAGPRLLWEVGTGGRGQLQQENV